jgi:hypothetical protein
MSQEELSNLNREDVVVNGASGSEVPNGSIKGDDKFMDPGQGGNNDDDPNRVPTPPDLVPNSSVDNKSLTEKLLDLQVTQSLFRTYDKVAEATGAPNIEKIGNDIVEVHTQWKGEGIVAAAKTATSKSINHTTNVVGHTMDVTKAAAGSTWQKVTETTTNITNKSIEKTKPYLQRVAENPQVDSVVGTVRNASVGAGSMATTIAATVTEKTKSNLAATKEKMDNLRGYTPEYFSKQATEEEAWKQVLCGGNGGQELQVPARQELTSSFFVKAGSVLTWKFRVQSLDIGFAVRLRVQGDGGSTEVDVFAMQKYSSGVTVQGEWSPTTDSSLTIVWDNSYSYLRGKVVAFQAVVKTLEEHNAEQLKEKNEKEQREQEATAAATEVTSSEVTSSEVTSSEQAEESQSPQSPPQSEAAESQVEAVNKPETEPKTTVDKPVVEEESPKEQAEPSAPEVPVVDEKEKDADY